MRISSLLARLLGLSTLGLAATASAQYPQQQQPYPQQQQQYPQQQYPQQQYPQQQYPQQQQQYPQQQQQYPQQQQQYPQQQQQYPQQQYPQQQYPQQQYPQQQQQYPQQVPQGQTGHVSSSNDLRSDSEMASLYITGGLYGAGMGIWIDAIGHVKDPAIAILPPIGLAAGGVVGTYLVDRFVDLHRGVPSSISTGLVLGAVEGLGIGAVQYQHSDKGNHWSFATGSTVTFLTATGGGAAGALFGELVRPNPRSMGLITAGATFGAISGTAIGAGVGGKDWKDAGSIAGLVGYNVGIVGAGALSLVWTPTWQTQKYMWIGYGAGAAASMLIYVPYIFIDDGQPRRGLVANGVVALAGAGGGALLGVLLDGDDGQSAHNGEDFKPPFTLGFAPQKGGGALTAFGTW